MNFTILHFETLASTNTEAINQAKRGADEGLCVVARQQTAGRGRHGRTWLSPKDAGLYFSIVLRPYLEARFLALITLTAAIAVHDALEELWEIDCDIKWANDVHAGGKKISGILAETVETSKGLMVVVGIGINLTSSNLPPELKEIATSIENETSRIPRGEDLLQAVTDTFSSFYEALQGENGAKKIREEWTKRSSYASGKPVRVTTETETFTGTTRGIEETGALRVELETGEIRTVYAGDVENLRSLEN
jgi:BirA family biotin operon repressor/biotin-[acetyl-CoA-carboxylase] ligase